MNGGSVGLLSTKGRFYVHPWNKTISSENLT